MRLDNPSAMDTGWMENGGGRALQRPARVVARMSLDGGPHVAVGRVRCELRGALERGPKSEGGVVQESRTDSASQNWDSDRCDGRRREGLSGTVAILMRCAPKAPVHVSVAAHAVVRRLVARREDPTSAESWGWAFDLDIFVGGSGPAVSALLRSTIVLDQGLCKFSGYAMPCCILAPGGQRDAAWEMAPDEHRPRLTKRSAPSSANSI